MHYNFRLVSSKCAGPSPPAWQHFSLLRPNTTEYLRYDCVYSQYIGPTTIRIDHSYSRERAPSNVHSSRNLSREELIEREDCLLNIARKVR